MSLIERTSPAAAPRITMTAEARTGSRKPLVMVGIGTGIASLLALALMLM